MANIKTQYSSLFKRIRRSGSAGLELQVMAWLELPLSQSFSAVLAGPSVGPWWLGLAADLTRALGLSLAGQVHLQPRCSQKW